MSKIRLRFGRFFDFADPDSTPLLVEDVAWSLARENRYSNCSIHELKVGQHAVIGSWLPFVPDRYRLGILHHDDHEAVMRDICSPLKKMLPDYQELEKVIQTSILRGLGVEPAPADLIHDVDTYLLEAEMEQVWDENMPFGFDIWSTERARAEFLLRHRELISNQ